MGMIDVKAVFEPMPLNVAYCIIKRWDDWPDYPTYSDIDILVTDAAEFGSLCTQYVRLLYPDVQQSVHYWKDSARVDVLKDGKVDLRFDITAVSPWKILPIVDGFVGYVVGRRRWDQGAYVACACDELACRMLEYVAKHKERPDKVKHLDFIRAHYDDAMWDILSRWCRLPRESYPPLRNPGPE